MLHKSCEPLRYIDVNILRVDHGNFEFSIRIKYRHTPSENYNVLITFHCIKFQRKKLKELESGRHPAL